MGDLSRLWFHAEVYERDLPDIRLGQKAILRTLTVPGREFEGVVTFIDPNFGRRACRCPGESDDPPLRRKQ
jgi:multidrug resistance efflux pump